MSNEQDFQQMRRQMVEEQLRARGIDDDRVLSVMHRIPRHHFVPPELRRQAYRDGPLPIGEKQTISQPFIVALMSQMLELKGNERVLEIGTGCGYQTAILCELADYVYTLERFPLLADQAGATLTALGYSNLDIHIGDGSQGLADMGPFDAIISTAAAPRIPRPLMSQLHKSGGRLVLPVGNAKAQHLYRIHRYGDHYSVDKTIGVRFVPLVGEHGFKKKSQDKPKGGSSAYV
jgi:protein-L-isoaspartate(D-aspartate) O-methyltransferase